MKYIAFMRADSTMVVILYYTEQEKSTAIRAQMDMMQRIGHIWNCNHLPDEQGIQTDYYVVRKTTKKDLEMVEEIMQGYTILENLKNQ